MVFPRQDEYTDEAKEALSRAQAWVFDMRNSQMEAEHLMIGLISIDRGMTVKILDALDVNIENIKTDLEKAIRSFPKLGQSTAQTGQLYATPRLIKVLDHALQEKKRLKDEYIAAEHLLHGLASLEDGEISSNFAKYGLSQERIYHALKDIRGSHRVTDPSAESKYQALEKYSVDLTKLAKNGKLDPVLGRDLEIKRVIQTLSRRTKNNPVLIGDAGVGKTAIVEGLAQLIIEGNVPSSLKNRRVIKLEMSSLLAGSKFRGEFEERLKAVMDEIRAAAREIVLFIDELHTVAGAGGAEGAIDASNMMKPALARGELQVIGATTPEEYRKYIESDKALERRFTPVNIDEPSLEIAVEMLKTLSQKYENHHQIKISNDSIEAAVNLSARYITDRFLPDKAIDLIDESAAKLRIESEGNVSSDKKVNGKLVKNNNDEIHAVETFENVEENNVLTELTAENIAELISQRTSIPVARLVEKDKSRLLKLEERLHERVIGQNRAVGALSDAIRRQRSGVSDPNRPIGTFIFLGPTGVGKTELARALAESLFDDENNLVRIDMSEYQEKHTVSRLIGSPPGYVGYDDSGQLTEAIRRRPFRVVLFDEIEKAHPDVTNLLLQVLDDGRLTDSHGRVINFRNTVIIMTSNLGSKHIAKESVGFKRQSTDEEWDDKKSKVEESLSNHFRPEFLNRIDEIIIFDSLEEKNLLEIVGIVVSKVKLRMKDLGVNINVSNNTLKWLVNKGFDKTFGARPLRRAVQRNLENQLAKRILSGEFKKEDDIYVDVEKGNLKFSFKKKMRKSQRKSQVKKVNNDKS